jgi:hypothetical protein
VRLAHNRRLEHVAGNDWLLAVRAAKEGNVAMLNWCNAHAGHLIYHGEVNEMAVAFGRINVLNWLHRKRRLDRRYLCVMAARSGRTDVLKWAFERNITDDLDRACSVAVEFRQTEALKSLVAHGGRPDDRSAWLASLVGSLGALQFLAANGCFFDAQDCFLSAATNGHLDVMAWITSTYGVEKKMSNCQSVAYYGELEALQWMHAHGFPVMCAPVMREARNYPKVIWWLRANGCPERE